jgi:hypothetical protein
MTNSTGATERTWALIENERRRDRFVRRVSVIAWTVTFALVLLVAVMVGSQSIALARAAADGRMAWVTVMASAMPLLDMLWKVSLLVAGLSTAAVFLRLRTASLEEIQLRLAALEEMLASRPEGTR